MIYVVEVYRDGEWHIVGQYEVKRQADAIAADYRSRGERARITTD